MAKTMKELHEEIRQVWVEKLLTALADMGEDVYQVKSNEIAFPTLDSESNEAAVIITIKVPTTAYEPALEHESYKIEKAEKEEKKAKAKAEREAKAERDKAEREKAKELRAKAEALKTKK